VKELLVLSGKGGTGKTSVAASFIYLAGRCIACDYDVDASNLPILLKPRLLRETHYSGGEKALIDQVACIKCGLCQDLCRFDAIKEYVIDPLACEGCGFCFHICPVEAINMTDASSGTWYEGEAFNDIITFSAELVPGEENSGKLVAQLKQAAREKAREKDIPLIIADGPPGIGCSAISSLVGVNLVLIVAEPSISGFHDVKRVYALIKARGLKVALLINKYDLNLEITDQIKKWASQEGIIYVGRLKFSPHIANATTEAEIPAKNEHVKRELLLIWEKVQKLVDE